MKYKNRQYIHSILLISVVQCRRMGVARRIFHHRRHQSILFRSVPVETDSKHDAWPEGTKANFLKNQTPSATTSTRILKNVRLALDV